MRQHAFGDIPAPHVHGASRHRRCSDLPKPFSHLDFGCCCSRTRMSGSEAQTALSLMDGTKDIHLRHTNHPKTTASTLSSRYASSSSALPKNDQLRCIPCRSA